MHKVVTSTIEDGPEADSESAPGPGSANDAARPAGPRRLVLGLALVVVLLAAADGLLLFHREPRPAPPPPGPSAVDIGFAQDMIAHHQQAVVMTQLVTGKLDPATTALAEQIKENQLLEIGQLRGWLQVWGAPMQSQQPMSWLAAHDAGMNAGMNMGGAAMPGMATQDELNQLSAAPPGNAAPLFLQLMLRHHMGGLGMADYAAHHATVGLVRSTAQNIELDQTQESDLVRQMLTAANVAPLPPR